MTQRLTTRELLRAAHAAGFDNITDDVLRQWKREGLLPRPEVDHRYPEWTLDQLMLAGRCRQHERRLDELRFDVWWQGGWVEPTKLKASLSALLDQEVAELRAHQQGFDDPEDAALVALDEIDDPAASRSSVTRLMRWRVKRSRDDFDAVIVQLLVLFFGGQTQWRNADPFSEESPPIDAAEGLFALDRAASDPWIDDGSSLEGEVNLPLLLEDLRAKGMFSLDPAEAVQAQTNEALELARAHARTLAVLPLVAEVVETGGRDRAGLGILTALQRSNPRYLQALWVWIALLMTDQLSKPPAIEVLNALEKEAPRFRALVTIHRQFPQYVPYMGPDAEERITELSASELLDMRNTLNAWMDEHPDIQAAVDSNE